MILSKSIIFKVIYKNGGFIKNYALHAYAPQYRALKKDEQCANPTKTVVYWKIILVYPYYELLVL